MSGTDRDAYGRGTSIGRGGLIRQWGTGRTGGQTVFFSKTRFAVITRGRTGSNLLMSLLGSHPAIVEEREIFGENQLRRDEVVREIRRLGAPGYLEHQLRPRFLRSAVGIKILWHQLSSSHGERYDLHDLPDAWSALRAADDIKILYLTRRNVLASVLSQKVASSTGQFVRTKASEQVDLPTVRIDPEELEKNFEGEDQNHARARDEFGHHPFLRLAYEDLVDDRQATCAQVLEFLDVFPWRLRSNLVKQVTSSPADLIENYDELRARFAKTKWADHFDA